MVGELQSIGRAAGSANLEVVEGIVLTSEECTPENVSSLLASLLRLGIATTNDVGNQGLVTSAQNLNREVLSEWY